MISSRFTKAAAPLALALSIASSLPAFARDDIQAELHRQNPLFFAMTEEQKREASEKLGQCETDRIKSVADDVIARNPAVLSKIKTWPREVVEGMSAGEIMGHILNIAFINGTKPLEQHHHIQRKCMAEVLGIRLQDVPDLDAMLTEVENIQKAQEKGDLVISWDETIDWVNKPMRVYNGFVDRMFDKSAAESAADKLAPAIKAELLKKIYADQPAAPSMP